MKLPENWGKLIHGSCFAGLALLDAAMAGAGKAVGAGSDSRHEYIAETPSKYSASVVL